jgi:spore coat protein JC
MITTGTGLISHGRGNRKEGEPVMFNYEKRLEYPIHIRETNPKLAKAIITQYGGPNGELGASMRYLSQRYTMPYKEGIAILTDIGIEEKYCAFIILILY